MPTTVWARHRKRYTCSAVPTFDQAQALREAQERFVYAEDTTLQGIYLKLRLLAETESLSSNLDGGPHLLWPRIILTILRDLKALGSLQEPAGAY